jgi:phosphopantothenoylcysteine decarboxylase/COX assembly protein 2
MHPPLTLENHPLCREVVIACNEQKWALDACLKTQKLHKSRENNAKAQAEKARLRARVEKYGHATVDGKLKG